MSFLDAITAGFGAVVLLFMLVSANALLEPRAVVDDREAEARRWELRVLTGQRNLVQLQGAAREPDPRVDCVARACATTSRARSWTRRRSSATLAAGLRRAASRRSRSLRARARAAQRAIAGARGLGTAPTRTARGPALVPGRRQSPIPDGAADGRPARRDPRRHLDEHARSHDRQHPAPPQHVARPAAARAEVAAGRQHGRLAHDADRSPARRCRSSASATRRRG